MRRSLSSATLNNDSCVLSRENVWRGLSVCLGKNFAPRALHYFHLYLFLYICSLMRAIDLCSLLMLAGVCLVFSLILHVNP